MTIVQTRIVNRLKTVFSHPLEDNPYTKALIGLITVLLILMLFPYPESLEYVYNVGSVWTDKDLIAPFSFPVYRDARDYESDRLEAGRSVNPVFIRKDDIIRGSNDSLFLLFTVLSRASHNRSLWLKSRAQADSVSFVRTMSQLPFSVSEGEWTAFGQWDRSRTRPSADNSTEARIRTILDSVYHAGVVDRLTGLQPHKKLAVRRGNEEELLSPDALLTLGAAVNTIIGRSKAFAATKEQTGLLRKILAHVVHPNILYDEQETTYEIKVAEDNVPRTVGFVQENERIVSRNTVITDEIRLKLDSYRRARIERASEFSEWKHWTGGVLHVVLVLGLYTFYIYNFRKKIFRDNRKLVLIGLLILIETLFAYLSVTLRVAAPIQFLILVPAASMLLAIVFDSRVAFYGTVTIALLVGGIRGNDYGFMLTSLIAGAMATYTVRDISNRTQIFRSLIFIFLGYAIPIVAMAFEAYDTFSSILISLAFALVNAVCSPMLSYGLLIFFERAFNVTTDLSLLELADLNHPLLHRLSEEAPGTYHHSMTIGSLAEAAAEAIHANPILARVGGYYHDIGKMVKPEYFVENQVGSQNRHNRLKPRMSALIIQSHIKEGVELGKEFGLPQRLLDFIPQHHGTTRMSYFYDKALKQAARRGLNETINEADFRYPGPKPQTKEAAIIMLADSIEATTRAIAELTPQRLRQVIENLIQQRFVEGQLDECELTLRDLTEIQEAFYTILLGIHHQRITYPETQTATAPGPEPAPATPQETPPAEESRAPEQPEMNYADETEPAPPPGETHKLLSHIPPPDHSSDPDERTGDQSVAS